MIHSLKTCPNHFEATWQGVKRFEVRLNDRGYVQGDLLLLEEYTPNGGYTGRKIHATVLHILDTNGMAQLGITVSDPSTCIMSIAVIARQESDQDWWVF